MNSLWKRTIVVAMAIAPAILACGESFGEGVNTGGLAGLACPEINGRAESATFAADARANATIRAFVMAAGDLGQAAARVEDDVSNACLRMGHDLGVPDDAMRPTGNAGGRAEGACRAVAARIDAILREGASASVQATYTPPECRVQADAYASCAGQCNVSVDPGYVIAHCSPPELSGTCEGTCEGQCDGTCNGDCAGACSAKDASGRCAGKCSGTCNGRCDATCHAKCSGTWRAPQCATQVKAPEAHGDCDASCKAHADLTAQCTEPRVGVQASVHAGEVPKLVATLQANLPALIRAEVGYGQRIGGDVQVLVDQGSKLPSAFAEIGGHAVACVAAAADVVAHAQASLRVSVEVSAEVSGKVGAHAG